MKEAKKLAEHFSKQREVFADSFKKNLLKLLAHLDIGNQNNWNKICAVLSLFTDFLTEFESTLVIILKQFFAESEEKIDE